MYTPPFPPGASSEISESQIALPSFEMAVGWRLICRLGVHLQLSIISMLYARLQLSIHQHA